MCVLVVWYCEVRCGVVWGSAGVRWAGSMRVSSCFQVKEVCMWTRGVRILDEVPPARCMCSCIPSYFSHPHTHIPAPIPTHTYPHCMSSRPDTTAYIFRLWLFVFRQFWDVISIRSGYLVCQFFGPATKRRWMEGGQVLGIAPVVVSSGGGGCVFVVMVC